MFKITTIISNRYSIPQFTDRLNKITYMHILNYYKLYNLCLLCKFSVQQYRQYVTKIHFINNFLFQHQYQHQHWIRVVLVCARTKFIVFFFVLLNRHNKFLCISRLVTVNKNICISNLIIRLARSLWR